MTSTINNTSSFMRISRSFIILAFIFIFSASAHANKATATTPLAHVLNLYYDLKDALVSSDAVAASKKATELFTAINEIGGGSISGDEYTAFHSLQGNLSDDAKHIADARQISQQREYFASLSLNMYTLAKAVKISVEPVYEDYCPMQKAYWLSNERAIKNPYYGSQMLTCGKVANTIQ